MSKRNLNKILPVLCLSLCWVYSCSQSAVEQPSTYSKTEEAAYKEALIASRDLIAAIQDEQIASEVYAAIQEKARLAQAKLAQAKEAYNAVEKASKDARRQAKKSALSKNIKGTWAINAYVISDSACVKAESAFGSSRRRLEEASKEANKFTSALRRQAAQIKSAQRRVEKARRDVYMAAALGAFRHVADEAIAKTQSEFVAQHDQ